MRFCFNRPLTESGDRHLDADTLDAELEFLLAADGFGWTVEQLEQRPEDPALWARAAYQAGRTVITGQAAGRL